MRNQNKKMSLIFPLSQDSELGDKDLNKMVGVSKAKNWKKYTTPSKLVIIGIMLFNLGIMIISGP